MWLALRERTSFEPFTGPDLLTGRDHAFITGMFWNLPGVLTDLLSGGEGGLTEREWKQRWKKVLLVSHWVEIPMPQYAGFETNAKQSARSFDGVENKYFSFLAQRFVFPRLNTIVLFLGLLGFLVTYCQFNPNHFSPIVKPLRMLKYVRCLFYRIHLVEKSFSEPLLTGSGLNWLLSGSVTELLSCDLPRIIDSLFSGFWVFDFS